MNIINTNSSEIAKIVYDYIERGISTEYDLFNSPPPPIYIGPVKVKTLKERLEEATMHADCEFCIKRDICTRDVPKPCRYKYTEEERIADQAADRVGVILNATYLPSTYHKKEDNEMKKATSVQNIKNVKDISFEIEYNPLGEECELTIVASTDDDIFEFEFEGSDLLQSCKKAGLFTVLEKDQKIKELKETIKKLEHADMLDKEAAYYWSKEHDTLSERFAKLQEENKKLKDKVNDLEEKDLARQKAYDILDKALQNSQKNCNKWYEKWVKMQSDQDGHTNTRADILDQAKKCVCGQREQDYGTPESNFQLIADLWNDYLKKERSSIVVDATDVAMMMALMKIARIRNGGGSGDSFVYLAGYAACGGEIWYGGKTSIPEGE